MTTRLSLFLLTLLLLACSQAGGTREATPSPQPRGEATPNAELPSTATASQAATPPGGAMRHGLVNLEHLNFLVEHVTIAGQEMAIVHIYSEAPEYEWVDASGEGIACVDDVGRAALVYLEYYERYGDARALEQARRLLRFVTYLQADDGQYYNFVTDREGTINTTGITSYKDWGWWAARGQWALAHGYRVFKPLDPAFAAELQEHYLRGENALAAQITGVGQYGTLHGVSMPAWLLKGGGDLTADVILGLAEYQAAEPNPQTQRLLTQLAQGVAEYRLGGPHEYPFGVHPTTTSSTALWHAWGSRQVHALARAGQLLGRQDWIDSARGEADNFFAHMVASEMISEMGVVPTPLNHIAYGQNVVVSGFMHLARATGDDHYARLGGLAASWFLGNNLARTPMYDPETGRGYDGLRGASAQMINYNAGAESTIEALWALLQVVDDPVASRYLEAQPQSVREWHVFEAENGVAAAGEPEYGSREGTGEARFSNERFYALRDGDTVRLEFELPEPGDYYLYTAHMRQAPPERRLEAEALRAAAPPEVDGALDDWAQAQPLPVNSQANVLRGAGWPGPDEASFTVQYMWDPEHLYVAARVHKPEHAQPETGANVWRGDAMWLYFDTRGDRGSVNAKLTLAQTPDGPQVWDWRGGQFLPGARLAWQQVEGGFTYEAALPWASLFVEPAPEAGKRLNFEAGMGFGGAFLTWTGRDPDTASNLAPLTLVQALSAEAIATPVASAQESGDVALAISLDGGAPWLLEEAISPDRDYLWLDLVTPEPIQLAAGAHTLEFRFAGANPDRQTVVDAFLLQPAVDHKELTLPDGSTTVVEHSMVTGETTIRE